MNTDDAGRFAQFTVIEPRAVPLGGPRAMTVHRSLPARETSLVGAWCFVDHFGPDDVSESGGMAVPRHPHTGLATVSWLFEGAITHRDSLGSHALVEPGDLDLMVAGYGITHSEFSTQDTTILHGVQLWYALPDRARFRDREFLNHTAEVLEAPGATMRVGLGKARFALSGDGAAHLQGESPVETDTALFLAQIDLAPGAGGVLDLVSGHEYAVLIDRGAVELEAEVDGHGTQSGRGERRDLVAVPGPANAMTLRSVGEEPLRVLVIGGEPLGEDIIMWWNFVGRTHEEIVAFRERYELEISASDAPESADIEPRTLEAGRELGREEDFEQYGPFARHTPEALPAPKMPPGRLRPRGRVQRMRPLR